MIKLILDLIYLEFQNSTQKFHSLPLNLQKSQKIYYYQFYYKYITGIVTSKVVSNKSNDLPSVLDLTNIKKNTEFEIMLPSTCQDNANFFFSDTKREKEKER